jgi:hypothetical protein
MTPAERILAYERITGQTLAGHLGTGPGQDGLVMESSMMTAVKFFDRQERFTREAEVYSLRLNKDIRVVAGHNIPRLINIFPSLLVVEMTIVQPPFILDFAGAKLPREVLDFSEEVMDEHYERPRELFDGRWNEALLVVEMFRRATGYTLLDIHPGNIAFEEDSLSR